MDMTPTRARIALISAAAMWWYSLSGELFRNGINPMPT
jgi:hypothetical protein